MSATIRGRYSDQTSERYSDQTSERRCDAESREQRVEGREQRVEVLESESLRDSLSPERRSPNALLELELKPVSQVQTARAPGDRLATLAEIARNVDFDAPNKRHPLVRTGPRAPIPGWIRLAVWFRDRGVCSMCTDRRERISPWELDHITPWSAGGSDDSTNLRVLCVDHNQLRSNWGDVDETPRRPITWWCTNCTPANEPVELIWTGDAWACSVHGSCRASRAANRTGETDWLRRGPMDLWLATTAAYCAHCNRIGYTDRPL